MAVYSPFSNNHVAAAEDLFKVGKVIATSPISEGVSNSNYLLNTEHGEFVATIVEQDSSQTKSQLEFVSHVSSELVPAPLSSVTGSHVVEVEGKPMVIFPRIKGSIELNPTHSLCYEVGKELSRIHVKSKSFSYEIPDSRPISWIKQSLTLLKIRNTSDSVSSYITNLERGLNFVISDSAFNAYCTLPSGVIHADLFKDNVLVSDGRVSGFLDFNYACSGVFLYDLCIAINSWCRDNSAALDVSKASAMIEGYSAYRRLTQLEISLYEMATMHAAVRFQASRLMDYVFSPSSAAASKDLNYFNSIILESI